MTAPNTVGRGWFSVDFAGVAATTGGAIASVANPEGATLLITRAILYISANSTGAANLTAGLGATATTAGDDIVAALAMAAAAGVAYNGFATQVTAKTAVTAPAQWTSTKFLNIQGSATTVGLAGTLFVEYIRLT